MGYKLLIKTFLFMIVIVEILSASTDIEKINKLVKNIKKERIGLSADEVKSAKNPFVKSVKNSKNRKYVKIYKKKRPKLFLNAIINNRAKINHKWYDINSKIDGYKLIKICNNYVILKRANKTVYLYLKFPKNKKIKFSSY